MREVCVFLSPSLYQVNGSLIEGLSQNLISVSALDATKDDYVQAIEEHADRLRAANTDDTKKIYQPRLCLAFEDTCRGIRKAKKAGMCALGIGGNHIELERLRAEGAHAVGESVSSLLEEFHVESYHQLQYLPYSIHLKLISHMKFGYPLSLLDSLSGRFHCKEDDYDEAQEEDSFELDPHAPRVISRQILGVEPGSLADVYINNVGWPQDDVTTFFLDTHELERDIVRMFGRFYNCPDGMLRGFVTSGGTEGNFSGLWWNRDYLKNRTGFAPIFLTSDQTHYSVRKAAQQLAIDMEVVGTNHYGELDCEQLANTLDRIALEDPLRPILLNGNLGTTQTGALDDLVEIHRLLEDKVRNRGQDFAIHVDAALMGACLPICKPFGDINLFKDIEVHTMAISGHKFFGSVCICGICLTTASFLDSFVNFETKGVDYLEGLHDMTPSGSRSGFSTLSLHNTLCGLYMHTDAHRLRLLVAQCYRNVEYFKEELSKLVGAENVLNPPNSLNVCFPRPSPTLMSRYQLMPVSFPHHGKAHSLAGVCILINLNRAKMDRFLSDYARDAANKKRRAEGLIPANPSLETVEPETLPTASPESFVQRNIHSR